MATQNSERPQGATRWLRVAAIVLAAAFAAFWVLFAVGETLGGDPSGLAHLAPVLAMVLLVILALRRPEAGSVALMTLGVAWCFYLFSRAGASAGSLTTMALVGAPFVAVGLLFGASVLLARRSRGGKPAEKAAEP